MRLIDADAVKLPKGYFETVTNVPRFYEWLDTLPTIDAVPVKHGKWLPYEYCTDGTWDKCSVCGVAHRTRDKYIGFMDQKEHVFQERLNYCPNCGAKMEAQE